jgi:hypothetical protein
MLRYLADKPVPPEAGEIPNPYKLIFEEQTAPVLSLHEEVLYYQNFGEFDAADLIEELARWDQGDIPYKGERFPILEALAAAHYGLT